MVQQKERQVKTKRWKCHVCAEHEGEYAALGLPPYCRGRPLPGYKVEGLPVCETAAIFDSNTRYRRHLQMISKLIANPAIHEGRTRTSLENLRAQCKKEIPLLLTGANTGGVANLTGVSDRLADFLAMARFIICSDLLQGAKTAIEELASGLPEGKDRAIRSILDTAESDLEPYERDPTKLSKQDRLAYWGAAKRASLFLLGDQYKSDDGLEATIRRIGGRGFAAGTFRWEFRVRQLMAGLKLSREEAELVADKGLESLQAIAEESGTKGTPAGTPVGNTQPEGSEVALAVTPVKETKRATRRTKAAGETAKKPATRRSRTNKDKTGDEPKPRARRPTTPTVHATVAEGLAAAEGDESVDPRMADALATALANEHPEE